MSFQYAEDCIVQISKITANNSPNKSSYMIRNDGELDSVAGIQVEAVALHFWHVEKELFALFDFVVQKSKLSFDWVDDCSLLLSDSGDLDEST